jgi:hypothetical protein
MVPRASERAACVAAYKLYNGKRDRPAQTLGKKKSERRQVKRWAYLQRTKQTQARPLVRC